MAAARVVGQQVPQRLRNASADCRPECKCEGRRTHAPRPVVDGTSSRSRFGGSCGSPDMVLRRLTNVRRRQTQKV